ncbi:hypothetical protein [Arcticibacter tournemirensis]|uniref:Outer membrane protein beta-barrel domain-containing protein n=1 Tax=Arcticibacter tournemirensis TaxID=699437 RepID=A0A4Q0MBK2_9SPHI|nr:hypothetical protein [Arcticibacter tournemirensis]RXF70698.1 hypothetical protein EKH83_08660 [Arcticibacter tournemirensis]
MKKPILVSAIITLIFFGEAVFAQQSGLLTDTLISKRAQTVYVEMLGPGLTISGNYDTRFSKRRDGLGGRIGIGYIAADGNSITTIPVGLNYLLGKGKNFFEVGAGVTYLNFSDNEDEYLSAEGDGVLGNLTFGYRLQPVDSGFSFRGGFSPLFGYGSFIPWVGFSFGYAF